MGKIRINQMLVPCTAWILAIPRIAISEEVSKPRPKTTPSGYIFHGRSIALNSFPSIRVKQPPPSRDMAAVAAFGSSYWSPYMARWERATRRRLIKGATGGSNNDTSDDDDCAVAQTEEGADSCRSLSTGDQPSRGEIDGRDVVSVKRMP
ncbi:unnamed protein product [Clonostachys solani]|uniref:Uncharacterized protein n=1 Tax=Clonostachys solani TaxID=160281 RepID=A0A9N9ZC34_9HYPO|nr:unnamed protein product [Clonostachys solani]